MEDFMCGFHWPITVMNHLHMHIIAPTATMNFFNRNVIFSKKYAFGTVDRAIQLLEEREIEPSVQRKMSGPPFRKSPQSSSSSSRESSLK